jgi:putative peptidoglycan lipid II flippase
VGAGILFSRVLGLVRTRLQAGALGKSVAADAFTVAFRIPNLLQNLFGEGSLSASFVPVYARLLRDGEEEEAGRTAGAVFAALALVISLIVLLGVVFTPQLTWLIAHGLYKPGKEVERDLAIRLTRILFPGAGILVLSAWCLGILNSHRRFFLSYAAPVMWNVAMIAALIIYRHGGEERVAVNLAWASVVGSALQFFIQVPAVLSLVRRLRFNTDFRQPSTRLILRQFIPAFISKGVAQLSAFIDIAIATSLPATMVGLIGYAQNLYMLPVSLFGMSISASELAEMSHLDEAEAEAHAAALRTRLNAGLRRIAFLVIPSSMAFLALGGVLVGVLFENRRFTADATQTTWAIVAGSAVGLLANTMGRVYSTTFSALKDTRTPLNFALVRVTLTAALGWLFAILIPRWFNLNPTWGAAGLTASAGIAAWVEFTLLRNALNRRIGVTGAPRGLVARLWACAVVSAAAAWGVKLALSGLGPLLGGGIVISVYGAAYFAATMALGIPEARAILGRVQRRFG